VTLSKVVLSLILRGSSVFIRLISSETCLAGIGCISEHDAKDITITKMASFFFKVTTPF
jgi:hypothetical protein